jgi:hypothetical protein
MTTDSAIHDYLNDIGPIEGESMKQYKLQIIKPSEGLEEKTRYSNQLDTMNYIRGMEEGEQIVITRTA